jgi:hypothetical protein
VLLLVLLYLITIGLSKENVLMFKLFTMLRGVSVMLAPESANARSSSNQSCSSWSWLMLNEL